MIDFTADTILFHGEPVATVLPNLGATVAHRFREQVVHNADEEIETLEKEVKDLEGEVGHMADAFVNVERAIALIAAGNTTAALAELESARTELER